MIEDTEQVKFGLGENTEKQTFFLEMAKNLGKENRTGYWIIYGDHSARVEQNPENLFEWTITFDDDSDDRAVLPQPKPKEGKVDVYPLVLEDIIKRVVQGRRKYGTVLQTENGRDALWDLYQELIDAVMYLRQYLTEVEDG